MRPFIERLMRLNFSFRRVHASLTVLGLLAGVVLLGACTERLPVFEKVRGFRPETNARLREFFTRHAASTERKVAVFDGDGTTVGQVPHYLADECLYEHAVKHPTKKPDVIRRMQKLSNVSMEYVQLRVRFFEGDTLESVRRLGVECYNRMYSGKIYAPMQELVRLLQKNGFEVWVVTASPEALYQEFLSRGLGIGLMNVIGVKSVIRDGRITSEMVRPVPQDHGKLEAIETFIQARPLLSGGNSRGDKEMIEFSRDLKLIINPDRHVGHDQKVSIAQYAEQHGWLVENIRDATEPGFPSVTSRTFGVRKNAENPGPSGP